MGSRLLSERFYIVLSVVRGKGAAFLVLAVERSGRRGNWGGSDGLGGASIVRRQAVAEVARPVCRQSARSAKRENGGSAKIADEREQNLPGRPYAGY